MKKNEKIFVAGHTGLVGSAIVRALSQEGYEHIVVRSHTQLDLTQNHLVKAFFEDEKPDHVFLAAAKVGGIWANDNFPADFIQTNLQIQNNVIAAAQKNDVKRLLFLGSSCIYPRECPQPIKEEYILTGPLEPTNRPYALAKIAGIEMCSAFNRQFKTQYLAVMPTNLYGPGDNYDLQTSHVIPALIRKMHEAKELQRKEVIVWGTGSPYREFLYSDDLAKACLFLMTLPETQFKALTQSHPLMPIINVGSGVDLSIAQLAKQIAGIVGFEGEICFDAAKPDGTPRKRLCIERIQKLGWTAFRTLEEGIRLSYEHFKQTQLESSKAKPFGSAVLL